MRINKCDICGNNVQYLNTLVDELKTYEVEEVCNHCLNKIDDLIGELRREFLKTKETKVKELIVKMYQAMEMNYL